MTDDIQTVIPHSKFGTPECSGCLFARIGLESAVIACNECGKIVRRVAAGDLQRTLNELELQLEVATALCRHCRAVNLFPGFSRVEAFVCQTCGKGNA
jgi:ribosomal protein S27E